MYKKFLLLAVLVSGFFFLFNSQVSAQCTCSTLGDIGNECCSSHTTRVCERNWTTETNYWRNTGEECGCSCTSDQCSGDQIRRCDCVLGDPEDCSPGFVCRGGRCASSCTVNENRCNGDNLEICTAGTPNKWTTIQTCNLGCNSVTKQCNEPEYCRDECGTATGCAIGQKRQRCWSSYYAFQIDDDRNNWISATSCVSDPSCQAGACHPTANSCYGEVSPCSAPSSVKWVDNCGGVDCRGWASPTSPCGNTPAEPPPSSVTPTCTISLTGPALMGYQQTKSFNATVVPSNGTVDRVSFTVASNSQSLLKQSPAGGDDSTAPYSYNFQAQNTSGTATVNAVAFMSGQARCTATIQVQIAPSYGTKSCSVTVNDSSLDFGESVTVSVTGDAESAVSRPVTFFLENKTIGTTITGVPSGYEVISRPANGYNYTYYKLGSCDSVESVNNGSCSNSVTIPNLPVGQYYVHCGIETAIAQDQCSGNPYCTYEGQFTAAQGGINCSTWSNCGNSDWTTFSVNPVNKTIAVNAYDATNGVCSAAGKTPISDFTGALTVANRTTGVYSYLAQSFNSGTMNIVLPGKALSGISYDFTLSNLTTNYISSPVCSAANPNPTRIVSVTNTAPDTVNYYYLKLSDPWWQVIGGDVYARTSMNSVVPSTAAGTYTRFLNHVGNVVSPPTSGAAIAGNSVEVNTSYAPASRAWRVENSAFSSHIKEGYEYFKSNFYLSDPEESFADGNTNLYWNEDQWSKRYSDDSGAYFHEGNLWVTAPETNFGNKATVFVKGDLYIDRNITVDVGGFLAFIVDGNINIESGVTQVEGVYIADNVTDLNKGRIIVKDSPPGLSNQLIAKGVFVGWGGVEFERFMRGDQGVDNSKMAAEQFHYRGDFIVNAPEGFKRSGIEWQEIVPNSSGVEAAPTPTPTPTPLPTAQGCPIDVVMVCSGGKKKCCVNGSWTCCSAAQ